MRDAFETLALHWMMFRRHDRYSIDEAVRLFRKWPAKWFAGPGSLPYEWAQNTTQAAVNNANLTAQVGNKAIGYVEGIQVFPQKRMVYVTHIAVSIGLEKMGLGTLLAKTFRDAVRGNYDVDRIVFQETHKNYQNVGYEAFFKGLGATQLETMPDEKDKWEWLIQDRE